MMVESIDAARRRHQAPSPTRIPPHNLEAEESLLGAMLLSQEAIAAALEVGLSSMCFYKPAHGHVFDAIAHLYGEGAPADPVTVAEVLSRHGHLEAIGGPATLISLQARTPAIGNATRYGRIVEEHALLRRLIGAGGDIVELGYSLPDDVGAAVDEAEARVFDVAQHRVAESISPLREVLERQLDHLESLGEQGLAITGLPTGFRELDKQLSGLQPSNLIVLGARPSMGKTALALNMAAYAATHVSAKVLIFSLEMNERELGQRLLAAEARVDSTKLRNGQLDAADWARISTAVGRLAEAPIFIDDNPHLTTMEIRAKARRHKSREGLDLVVVDYLQLMSQSGAENRQNEVAEVSRGLKLLARELDVPVLALSQLSRNPDNRADKRPVLADLRDSGGIEQDSDTVIFIFRDELYDRDSADRGVAEIHVAKQRSGPVGLSRLAFLPYPSFANLAGDR